MLLHRSQDAKITLNSVRLSRIGKLSASVCLDDFRRMPKVPNRTLYKVHCAISTCFFVWIDEPFS